MPSRTFVMIKPDAVRRNLTGEILRRIEDARFKIVALEMKKLTSKQTREFYQIHERKIFFKELVCSIANRRVVGMILEKKNAVRALRSFIGTTDPKKAGKGSIRRDFGIDVTRNSVHASDSAESYKHEMKTFFK